MKKVSILTVHSRIPNFFLFPVRKNSVKLKTLGYDVHIYRKSHLKCFSSDILCLSSKYFTTWWKEPARVFDFIGEARKYTNKIVWFDDSDSTGVSHFELLPIIDLYLKKQLLKDKKLYGETLYSDRLFTDYYHNNFGITDETPYQSKPLEMSYSQKVHLSWNLGLGDYAGDTWPRHLRFVRNYLMFGDRYHFTETHKTRPIDVLCRGTRSYARNTISYHRQRIGEILERMTDIKPALTGSVPYKQYIQEIKDAKIFLSPFGWGEISFKDFEAWIYGSALMKPDVSHMETWPDFFVPGETYVPIKWDFSNLAESIRELLEDERLRHRIAANGQSRFAKVVSDEGMDAFCSWFVQQIEK